MWVAVTLVIDAPAAEKLADALLEAGAVSVDVADADAGTPHERPLFDEPCGPQANLWNRARVTALFPAGFPVAQTVPEALRNCGVDANLPYETAPVAEQDWVRATQDQFGPLQASPRLWVVPSWSKPPCESAINLTIDPGLAFGTGSHATTRLCLEWLDANIRGGEQVLDYGCGSGILTIAAMKLGAGRACGVDIDAAALVAAANNAMQNRVTVDFAPVERRLDGPFDIVIANILANPLHLLAPVIAALVKKAGRAVLSGVLEDQAEALRIAYSHWFDMETIARAEGWVLLSGTRR
jgi:ribosomal protein L11 methyltransferase